jgi:predicted acylesterase/phospholipase RssA
MAEDPADHQTYNLDRDRYLRLQQKRPEHFGARFKFHHVFTAEANLISKRRAEQKDRRGRIKLETEAAKNTSGEHVLRPAANAKVVGLALSGGGIRSAAFCLGALQALHHTRVMRWVDYLSTVSGGGYIGSSLTAAQELTRRPKAIEGKFPFASRLNEDEPPALQHLRDHSNYLFPRGSRNLLHNALIYGRGLAVNVVLVGQCLLAAAALTMVYFSVRDTDGRMAKLLDWLNPLGLRYFLLTFYLALFLFAAGIVWGIYRSWPSQAKATEIPGRWTVWLGWVVLAFLIIAFCEFQPFILDAMFGVSSSQAAVVITDWIKTLTKVLAPVGAAMAFLANKFGEYIKSLTQSPGKVPQIKAAVSMVVIYAGGLILPAAIWMIYLNIAYWGICIDRLTCACLAPPWLAETAYAVFPWSGHSALSLYVTTAVLCVVVSALMRPNANSLHPLYRDRLSKAFLFNPHRPDREHEDLVTAERPSLTQISGLRGPYHLINTALNVEASKVANRRGRNADFFIFSPKFVGSKSTDYVATANMEEVATGLDLPTAMAVSGAAVSSNMGAQNIKPLTATLALLNIRLGYWLRNPRWVYRADPEKSKLRCGIGEYLRKNNLVANYYFLLEAFGFLSEKRKSVYLTDGGHIENLGIYELLRRRCRVIIAVDAEADREMAFGSFNTLERYALIDMGIRIDLPWQQIADESLKTGKAIDQKNNTPKDHGPHGALGQITYPGGRKGCLIYIKASLTGDENDCVFDYKKRYSDFPHETTLDQLFTEEQFEAYRALGFHAAYGVFSGSDQVAYCNPENSPDLLAQVAFINELFDVKLFEPTWPESSAV